MPLPCVMISQVLIDAFVSVLIHPLFIVQWFRTMFVWLWEANKGVHLTELEFMRWTQEKWADQHIHVNLILSWARMLASFMFCFTRNFVIWATAVITTFWLHFLRTWHSKSPKDQHDCGQEQDELDNLVPGLNLYCWWPMGVEQRGMMDINVFNYWILMHMTVESPNDNIEPY